MPSSDAEKDAQTRWGRIFMGPDVSRESSIDKLLNAQERELWTQSTEQEYMQRVRQKAMTEAQHIVEKAQQRHAEICAVATQWAETVKEKAVVLYGQAKAERDKAVEDRHTAERVFAEAREQGFQAGLKAAEQAVAAHEAARDAASLAVLQKVQEQCNVLFEQWRGELLAVSREAVETATGWILQEDRVAVLEHLLEQTVRAMEERQALTVRVNPADAELCRELLGRAQQALGIQRWEVAPDPQLEVGSLVLESASGRAENLPAMRRAIVENVLRQMTVPESELDHIAQAAVQAPMPELETLAGLAASPEQAAPSSLMRNSPPVPPLEQADEKSTAPTLDIPLPDFEEPSLFSDEQESTDTAAVAAEALSAFDASLAGEPAFPESSESESASRPAPSLDVPVEEGMHPDERAVLERAEAAMEQALNGGDSLPEDVAAYILDAVTETPPSVGAEEAEPAVQPTPLLDSLVRDMVSGEVGPVKDPEAPGAAGSVELARANVVPATTAVEEKLNVTPDADLSFGAAPGAPLSGSRPDLPEISLDD